MKQPRTGGCFFARHAWDFTGSLISIHETIVDDLMKPLAQEEYMVRVYTRSDKPKYDFPEHIPADVRNSWKYLSECAKGLESSHGKIQVNLLINYDGYIDSQMLRDQKRMDNPLPITPSIDAIVRTAATSDTLPHRLSSGPILAMAETSFVVIDKTSPELTETDISEALDRVVSFRRNKKHRAEEIEE